MATPRFDFSSPQEEAPVRRHLPAFDTGRPSSDDATAVYIALMLMAVGIAAAVLLRRRRQRLDAQHKVKAMWDRVRRTCAERGLTPDEERHVTEAIHELEISVPDRVILSANRFNSMLAPDLAYRVGDAGAERIRRKLFHGGTPSQAKEDTFASTRDLHGGQKLRLHFDGQAGTHTCTVINVSPSSFVVTLPMAGERHVNPKRGDHVEGFMEVGHALYSFESVVQETFMGGVFACRMRHATDVHAAHQRHETRVHLAKAIHYARFAASTVDGGEIDLDSLQDQAGDTQSGTLVDLSVGGCSITRPSTDTADVSDFLQLQVRLLPDEPPNTILGQVVHITPIPMGEGGGQTLHLQFLGLDENAQGNITRAVHRLQRQGA